MQTDSLVLIFVLCSQDCISIVIDKSKCEYGWTDLAGECFKLFCENKYWSKARFECFKHEADLASFGENTLHVAMDYLEHVKVHVVGSETISIGLLRTGQNWTWLDGRRYNGTVTSEIPKGRLVWKKLFNKWVVEGAERIYYWPTEESSDMYFCQKLRGEKLSSSLFFSTRNAHLF